MAALFGFEFKRQKQEPDLPSFSATKETDDGALVISAGGAYGTMVDLDGTVRSEAELVTKYREMSLHPECDSAIDEIVNESIAIDAKDLIKINLDSLKVSDQLKSVIREEFDNCLKLVEFNRYAYEIYRRWYIDGRLYYHVVIDENNPQEGIKELRYIDPRKIRKVREVQKKRAGQNVSEPVLTKVVNEYYIFNDKGFNFGNKSVGTNTTGLKIARDSIIHVVSGLTDNQGTMVLSYLHKAIKALNQLSTLEDALVIYRLSRAPERRIWYIDVGNLPKMKAEQYVREIMVKHKNRLIYDAATGDVKDSRKFMCYALDTKIPLLDGRTLEIQEIIKEHSEGKTNWVYSCDIETGKFVPGIVSWAGITKHDAEVVRVTFDNGKSVVCTPDHKFPVWNKGFIEAKDLSVGESLIPGYRRYTQIMRTGAEYEQIYKNDTQTWEFTHREVNAWKKENGILEEAVYNKKHENSRKSTIHHVDFNGRNNNPFNLVMMNHLDHMEYHRSISNILYTEEIIKAVENCARQFFNKKQSIKTINDSVDLIYAWRLLNSARNIKGREIESLVFTEKDITRIYTKQGFKTWKSYYSQFDDRIREKNGQLKRGKTDKGSAEWKILLSEIAKNRTEVFCKTWKITYPSGESEIIENLNAFCRKNGLNRTNIKGKFGSRGYHAEILRNHKVVSVEYLPEKITVAALTIDQNETYHSHHTYLLDAGVYTKNTMLEDYWLPRREGGRGTEVTTLPGGANLGSMDDVLYFQKKFLQTLNVPVSRLNSDALFSIGRATEITRDELKFERFITRLRSRFSHLFVKMLEKQLVLKGITTIEDWQFIQNQIKFEFAKDNYFAELKEAEMLQNRIMQTRDMQDMAGKYVSHAWIRKNILQQTEDDIAMQDYMIGLENQSGDPRWVNPMIMQNEQIAGEQAQSAAVDQQQDDQSDETRSKMEEVSKAITFVRLMKEKGIKNRTPQEQSKYKAAVQIIAKNPEITQKLGIPDK